EGARRAICALRYLSGGIHRVGTPWLRKTTLPATACASSAGAPRALEHDRHDPSERLGEQTTRRHRSRRTGEQTGCAYRVDVDMRFPRAVFIPRLAACDRLLAERPDAECAQCSE